jgi:pantoate--beta-alanine ligase
LPAPAVVETVAEVRRHVVDARQRGCSVGLVPTMGALHAGHQSLLEAARGECGYLVASIFVNPTQFGPAEDFSRYPRPLEQDLERCRAGGVDLVYRPTVQTMYPRGASTFVEIEGLSQVLEGRFRPTHFRGVATVVAQLFNIVTPDAAYFGQKDYQQQTLIRKMCRELHLPVEIRVCPTVREPDGLALSSRNVYLNPEERRSALALSQSLGIAREMLHAGEQNLALVKMRMRERLASTPLVQMDYATLADPDTLSEVAAVQPKLVALVAARVGATRLIDNEVIEVYPSRPA